MPATIHCPNPDCGASYNVVDKNLGRMGRCKKCGTKFPLVPPTSDGSAPARPSSPSTDPGFGQKPPESTLPESLGRYRIVRLLGRGGMGAVYLAHDTRLDRRVALKIPYFGPADGPQAVQRFEREARAAANLDHPNLCPVYDVGEIDGIHYLTMPYIEGKPLSEAMTRDKAVTEAHAVAVTRKLALALQEAHAQGVVHRDLKPANIMIKKGRELVIMDFGLARMVGGEEGLTRTGHVLGTALYMAPEQAAGDAHAIGPPCDVYALGVILYELLTGVRPFEGPWSLVIGLKSVKDPDPPSKHRPDLGPELDTICLKALARDPKDRYATMAEFAEALNVQMTVSLAPTQVVASSGSTPAARGVDLTATRVFENLVGGDVTSLRDEKAPALRHPERPPRAASPRSDRIWLISAAMPFLLAGIIYAAFSLASNKNRAPVEKGQDKPAEKVADKVAEKVADRPVVKDDDGVPITRAMGMAFRKIPAGEFEMGSNSGDGDERPKHKVRITRPFELGATEVTVGQFRRFVDDAHYQTDAERTRKGAYGWDEARKDFARDPKYTCWKPGFSQTDDHPVVNVTWNDATMFCAWLGRKEGKAFRLPTEAEWEYACRAGTTSRFSFGDDPESLAEVGNVWDATAAGRKIAGGKAVKASDGYVFTAPVGRFRPNAWGLHDMHGNVWEWCSDQYDNDYYAKGPPVVDDPEGPRSLNLGRSLRGGSWYVKKDKDYLEYRSSYRNYEEEANPRARIGFRVVRLLD
jgi:formylglycine-generating enzyme required for sulfatase activity/serine/threonine protein kinase